jgi:hypothetical protein
VTVPEEELLVGAVVDVVVEVDALEDDAAPVLPLDPAVPESAEPAESLSEELWVFVVTVVLDEEDAAAPAPG